LKSADYEAVYGARQRRSSPQFAVFFRAQPAFAESRVTEVSLIGEPSAGVVPASAPSAIPGTGPDTVLGPLSGEGRPSRFGISVKKALGNAVVRNRIRRRIREILRRNRTEIPSGWDIVIHPRSSVAEAPFAPLEAELVRLLRGLTTRGKTAGPRETSN
jgi:ribonuclease P protein component